QIAPRKWLRQRPAESILEELRQRRLVRVPAADNSDNAGIEVAQSRDGCQPTHATTDGCVQNHRLEIFTAAHGAFVSIDRFDAVGHGGYFVTECIQQLRGEFTNSLLIVLDEDPLQRTRHSRAVAHGLYYRRFCPGCWKKK